MPALGAAGGAGGAGADGGGGAAGWSKIKTGRSEATTCGF